MDSCSIGRASTARPFACVIVQGIYGGGKIAKYLEFVGGGLGFNVVKGSCIRTLEPMDEKALSKMERTLAKQSRRFHARLLQPAYPAPSLFGLMAFRMSRTSIQRQTLHLAKRLSATFCMD